jgi:hypothetical protein
MPARQLVLLCARNGHISQFLSSRLNSSQITVLLADMSLIAQAPGAQRGDIFMCEIKLQSPRRFEFHLLHLSKGRLSFQ